MKTVSVFGLGYVGAVTAACLAHKGHRVVGVDVNPAKVEMVESGRAPVLAGIGSAREGGPRGLPIARDDGPDGGRESIGDVVHLRGHAKPAQWPLGRKRRPALL